MKNEDGVEHMFLCHHPLQWLVDADEVDRRIQRARIQLFAHKHMQKLAVIDKHLRIAAGAVHPDRKERDWKPRYNWITVAVAGKADQRTLEVIIYPRVWLVDEQIFGPDLDPHDRKESRSYSLPIDSWTPKATVGGTIAGIGAPHVPVVSGPPAAAPVPLKRSPMDPARTLAHRFLGLPFVRRMEVAQALSLLRDEDETLQETERSKQIFVRAKENRKLAQLWDEVEKRHGDGMYATNPFEK
jgi:hypothetical protein